jgi:FKBP-type peptidyl-prolyl cis-trans isomerase
MIKNEDRTTSPRMRIFFIIVAILLLGSTFAIYAGIVIGQDNKDAASVVSSEKQERLNQLAQEHQAEVDKLASDLSKDYFDTFVGYKSRVKAFNAADVTELKKEDLKKGDGDKIEDGTQNVDYSAYYIGWLSDGTIFDSSFDNASSPKSLKFPLTGSTSMIQGWLEGISGMRIGGVREITIPSVLGYGETDNGVIPANSPLKFVVMLVPLKEEPAYSDEYYQLYMELYYGGNTNVQTTTPEEESGE